MNLFSRAHEQFRLEMREWVESHLTPHADEWESEAKLPISVFQQLGSLGFLGLTQAQDWGGRQLDFGYTVVFAEELPRSKMMGLTLSILAQTNLVMPLLATLGTIEQKKEFLAPAIHGQKIGALASAEPSGGSDIVNATQCTAIDDGDFWVISGEKKYITNGPIADFIVVLARSKSAASLSSFSLIIVPADTQGFRVKTTLRKIGLNTSPTGWLEFQSCRVPKRFTLGKPNLGYFYHTQNLLEERLVGAVTAVSVSGIALSETVERLRQRRAYGAPLAKLQAVRHVVAEMAAEIEMCKRFVYSVCQNFKERRVEAREICMIKFKVAEIVQRTLDRCVQLHGGSGFLEENWISRAHRDARVMGLGAGVSELMKDLVAGYLRL